MKQNRIIVLTELFYPEKTSTGYYLTKIAEGLAPHYEVHVICGPATENFKQVQAPRLESINGITIHRCLGTSFNKDNLLGRVINLISKTFSIAVKALNTIQSNDKVLVVTNPPSLPIVSLVLKKLKGFEFLLLVHDVYPEALIAANLLKPNAIPTTIFKTINLMVYSGADKIITLGRDMQTLVIQKSSSSSDKVNIIPNWADHDKIEPIIKSENPLLKKLNIDKHFVFLYAGNMGRTHNLEIIVEAARLLKSDKSSPASSQPVSFLFIGNGAKKDWLEHEVRQSALDNIHILQYLPENEKSTAITACDVAIISFMPGMAGVSVPSRMYNQMAAGKPIIGIADPHSELALVIREEGIGWVVEPDNLTQLLETIKVAQSNPSLCQEMGQKARNVASQKYSYSEAIKLYEQIFI